MMMIAVARHQQKAKIFYNKLDGNSMELIKCEPLVVYQSFETL